MSQESALTLSDEEFAKLPIPVMGKTEPQSEPEPEVEETTVEAPTEPVEAKEEDNPTEGTTDEEKPAVEATNGLQEETTQTTEEIDYKKVYEEVFKPFKANGREMKADSIDDVRQLMQMGANYNKKMAALKPNLKVVKMLENNGLLDEQKLAFLIDLDKKNPDAIKKLIKDSGVDPLEVDIHQEVAYKANTYTVNDKELELDAVLSEIRETDTFNKTIDIIGNKWDDSSKRVLLDNPAIIRVINSQVSNGIYEHITAEVERLRVLGKLEGLSDIDAYKAVGDVLYAPRANANPGTQFNASASKATNREDPKLVEKRKAAQTTKSTVSNAKPSFNPLSMSDTEFEKIASSKFI